MQKARVFVKLMSKNSIGVKGLETDRYKISKQMEKIGKESKHFKAGCWWFCCLFPAFEGSSSGLEEVYLWLKRNLLSVLKGSTYSLESFIGGSVVSGMICCMIRILLYESFRIRIPDSDTDQKLAKTSSFFTKILHRLIFKHKKSVIPQLRDLATNNLRNKFSIYEDLTHICILHVYSVPSLCHWISGCTVEW